MPRFLEQIPIFYMKSDFLMDLANLHAFSSAPLKKLSFDVRHAFDKTWRRFLIKKANTRFGRKSGEQAKGTSEALKKRPSFAQQDRALGQICRPLYSIGDFSLGKNR
jgi:hypothetical protein